jgi:transcriptional regulator
MSSKKDISLYGQVKSPEDLAAVTNDLITNPPHDLTERQRRIVNYRMRGLTQQAIANLEKVSQPFIAKEMRTIRQVYKEQGRTIDQEQVLGETVSLYQEIEQRAWEIFFAHKKEKPSAANKALDTVMQARERTVKLMMDLGIMKKAATEVEHTVHVAPFIQQFSSLSTEEKQAALSSVLSANLRELDEPEPPQLSADLDIEDLEYDEAQEEYNEESYGD